MFLSVVAIVAALSTPTLATYKLQEHFQWNVIDYEYPTEAMRLHALQTGRFKPENNLPVGIEIWRDKMFVTVPRWREGIPSTLNYVPIHSPVPNPRLIPYPSLEENELGNCKNGLNTVYRIHADKCDRLWVLDTGTFGIGNTTQNPCPYTINLFDLKTDRRILRHEIKAEDIVSTTFIANTAVDVIDDCNDAYAYLSDELGYGLIVFSLKELKTWRFSHSYFLPDPLRGDFNIDGLNFQWGDEGIFGMSLSPPAKDGYKLLYFSPIASHRQFVVSTSTLRNASKVGNSWKEFYALDERGPDSHTTARVMDDFGVEFFNLIDQNAIGCWNSKNPYNSKYHAVVDKDDLELVFPCDAKIDKYRNLWVMSDRMSNFLIASLDYNQINFRVFFAPIDVLTKDTVCESNLYNTYPKYPGRGPFNKQQLKHWLF